jgi:hypothetical protein
MLLSVWVHFSEHVSVFRSFTRCLKYFMVKVATLLNYLALISGYLQEWFRSMVTDDAVLVTLAETISSLKKGWHF